MRWSWRYEGEHGKDAATPQSDLFPSQSDAESWLGEHWRDLAASGVAQVSLYEGTDKVYGPMPLSEG
jgi:hypothetical protein